jgi:hypothetical protein
VKRPFVICLILLLGLTAPACHKETEQDRVKKVITSVQKAVEEKDIRTILGHLSKTYRDPQGHDYDGIKGLLLFYFYRHQKISVYIPALDVSITGPTARAVFQPVLTGGNKAESAGDLLPEALGLYNFDVSLAKEPDGWKVTSAKWERAGRGLPEGNR